MRVQVIAEGKWFDIDAATKYDSTDGSKEMLYKTEDGHYVVEEAVNVLGNVVFKRKNKTEALNGCYSTAFLTNYPNKNANYAKFRSRGKESAVLGGRRGVCPVVFGLVLGVVRYAERGGRFGGVTSPASSASRSRRTGRQLIRNGGPRPGAVRPAARRARYLATGT